MTDRQESTSIQKCWLCGRCGFREGVWVRDVREGTDRADWTECYCQTCRLVIYLERLVELLERQPSSRWRRFRELFVKVTRW